MRKLLQQQKQQQQQQQQQKLSYFTHINLFEEFLEILCNVLKKDSLPLKDAQFKGNPKFRPPKTYIHHELVLVCEYPSSTTNMVSSTTLWYIIGSLTTTQVSHNQSPNHANTSRPLTLSAEGKPLQSLTTNSPITSTLAIKIYINLT